MSFFELSTHITLSKVFLVLNLVLFVLGAVGAVIIAVMSKEPTVYGVVFFCLVVVALHIYFLSYLPYLNLKKKNIEGFKIFVVISGIRGVFTFPVL